MLDEFLDVEDRAQLGEHLEGTQRQGFVVQASDPATFTAEDWLEDDITAECPKRSHGIVGRLADDRPRRQQARQPAAWRK